MRVDVVAAPVRYPRTPLLLLLVIAIVPALALLVLYRWAEGESAQYDESRGAVALVSGDSPTPGSAPVALLSTGLFDYRRAPDSLVDLANVNRLRAQVEPVFVFVDERSCAAVSVDGVPAGSVNAALPVIPASVQKLMIAAIALETLGPDFRYVTQVVGAPAVDGVVPGDLYLVGGGDPLLTSDDYPIEDDTYPAFNTTSLDRLADDLVAAGVTRIDGAVIGDGTRYDDEYVVNTWADGVAFVDAGPYDALLVNDSRLVGFSSTQSDPNEAAARELTRLLGARGVVVNRGWTSGAAPTGLAVLATVESEPLSSVVTEMLVNSDNNTAEMLLKELGIADRGEGTRVAGLNLVDRTLRSWGVPMDGVRILDGSGLSPGNRLTCAAVLDVLQKQSGGALRTALPIAGQTGTLAEEFTESAMSGRLAAKTGTLNNPPVDADPPAVKALAGYVDTGTDATIEFVMILNTPDITTERRFAPLWSALGIRFATYPEGPVAADLSPG
jgi:D-alanyl-D-alanine carboxypeptidase/D-alanyl-D-alanine-endopeptidase (penicillin-binding protein 4)